MDDDSRVRVSVVIPARNAEAMIGRTVAAARAQEVDGPFEVIVVDDGSTDGTGAVAADAGARVIRHVEPRGPADSRNAGVAAASAPVIAFTDADCVPAPGWLAAGVAALERADIAQGRVEPDPGVDVGAFDHTITVRSASGLFETANLFVRRTWFDSVGGFRPFIAPSEGHFGEDLVFGWAVVRGGGRFEFARDALVHHEVVRRGGRAWLAERRRLRLFPAATRVAPELRSRYFLRLFLSRRTAALDLAVVGMLAALFLRRPLLLALALPYARSSLRPEGLWRPAAAKQNLLQVAGDIVGLAALLAGSASARRLVL
jgi:glycosyltransferase involved in cell wall biosynthesis